MPHLLYLCKLRLCSKRTGENCQHELTTRCERDRGRGSMCAGQKEIRKWAKGDAKNCFRCHVVWQLLACLPERESCLSCLLAAFAACIFSVTVTSNCTASAADTHTHIHPYIRQHDSHKYDNNNNKNMNSSVGQSQTTISATHRRALLGVSSGEPVLILLLWPNWAVSLCTEIIWLADKGFNMGERELGGQSRCSGANYAAHRLAKAPRAWGVCVCASKLLSSGGWGLIKGL